MKREEGVQMKIWKWMLVLRFIVLNNSCIINTNTTTQILINKQQRSQLSPKNKTYPFYFRNLLLIYINRYPRNNYRNICLITRSIFLIQVSHCAFLVSTVKGV